MSAPTIVAPPLGRIRSSATPPAGGCQRASPSSPTKEASAASGRHECSPLIGSSSGEKSERPSWLRDAPIAESGAPRMGSPVMLVPR